MLSDELSKRIMDAFVNAQMGNIKDDLLLCTEGTYFNELTNIEVEGCFVDCGSYDGQTVLDYWTFKKKRSKAFAFEPDSANFYRMKQVFADDEDVVLINEGCWSQDTILSFSSKGDMSSSFCKDGDQTVKVTTIDRTVNDDKVAFIKMDVEGSEYEALRGAEGVITRDMPILAISAYHKEEDFITLIPYLHGIKNKNEKYKLYLRHHGCTSTELVLYGVPYRNKL